MKCFVLKYNEKNLDKIFNMKSYHYIISKTYKYNPNNLKILIFLHKEKKLFANYEIKNKKKIIVKGQLNYFKTKNRLEHLCYNVWNLDIQNIIHLFFS